MWVQVTLSALNMGGFGIQLKCAHKMKSMNMFHVLQKLTKNIQSKIFVKWWRGRQLFSDQWVKCWTTGTKQSWSTQSNTIRSDSKRASLYLIWSDWHLVQILYTLSVNIIILLYLDCTLFTSWEWIISAFCLEMWITSLVLNLSSCFGRFFSSTV